MRRVHLRGHANIRKRLLVHAGGFNLGLLMRQLIGIGTPRGLQDTVVAAMAIRRALINLLWALVTDHRRLVQRVSYAMRRSTATSAVARAGGAKWLSPRTARF